MANDQQIRNDITMAAAWVESCVEPMLVDDAEHMNIAAADYTMQAAKQWRVTIGSIRHALVERQAARLIASLDRRTRRMCGG